MIFADHFLVEAWNQPEPLRRMCAVLYRTQILTFKRTEHILNYRAPEVYTRLMESKRHNKLPHVLVGCVRCGAQQLLIRWVEGVDLDAEGRAYRLEFHPSPEASDDDYLRDCKGDEIAIDGCDLLGILRVENSESYADS